MSKSLESFSRAPLAPLAVSIAAGSLIGFAFLAAAGPPNLRAVDPKVVFTAILAALLIFGVLLPVLLCLLRRRRGGVAAGIVFFLAAIANSVTLGNTIVIFPQGLISGLVTVIAIGGAVLTLITAAERQMKKPGESKL